MSQVSEQDLVPVHGGLADLVDRIVPFNQKGEFLEKAKGLPSIRVSPADLSTIHRLADGALSPLIGPMKKEAYDLVLAEKVVISEGGRYAWAIPISLPVTDVEAQALSRGASCAVRTEEGEIVAVIEELEVFDWDKGRYLKSVYGTDRVDHPRLPQARADRQSRDRVFGTDERSTTQRIRQRPVSERPSPQAKKAAGICQRPSCVKRSRHGPETSHR